ncbi:MAG: serine/threonine protein kinase [Myxococcales bacterium]|nr:serine/threonine protein kinase [Myxococcales bacterium]
MIDLGVGSSFAERYEIGARLGRGGMGEVLLAHDRRIGRDIAIKLGRNPADSPGAARDAAAASADEATLRERLLREARVQGQLEHPAVVPVHDLGVGPDGAVYFTMKRVLGFTLDQIVAGLRRGDPELIRRFSRRRLLTAFLSICQAVELAHARGVIHRDLKPANMMLGDFGEVYVLDWGLARLASDPVSAVHEIRPVPPGESDHRLTAAGTFLGTPGYLPPEQARGEAIDARADVYALGAVLFELLTLHPLLQRGAPDDVIAATMRGADARASLRYPERAIPPELEVACIRATATDRHERMASVAELRGAVEGFLDGDRDVQQRQLLADQLAGAADDALPRALAGDRGAHNQAGQLASRALALAPDHPLAQQVIVRLALTPPREIPPEVDARVEETLRKTYCWMAKVTGVLYLSWLPVGAIVLWMGLRDPLTFAVWCGLTLVTAAVMLGTAWRGRYDAWSYFGGLVLSSVALAFTSRLFSPYVLTPTLLTVNALGFLLQSRPGWRPATLLVVVAALLTPVAAEQAGWIARTAVIERDRITILANAADFGQPATSLALIALVVAYTVVVGLTLGRLRDRRLAGEVRVELGAWQLAQLVPQTRATRAH